MAQYKQVQRVHVPRCGVTPILAQTNMFSSPLWRCHRETRVLNGSLDAQLTFSQVKLPWCPQTSRSHNGTSLFPFLILRVPPFLANEAKKTNHFSPLYPSAFVDERLTTTVDCSAVASLLIDQRTASCFHSDIPTDELPRWASLHPGENCPPRLPFLVSSCVRVQHLNDSAFFCLSGS